MRFKRQQLEDKMGLDMYAYVGRKGQRNEYYEQEMVFNTVTGEYEAPEGGVTKPSELAYWRKHPSLHGWMEQLWIQKGRPGQDPSWPGFNGVELELSWNDIDDLERAVTHGKLPFTTGFFFGKPADNVYYEDDLKFCREAKAEIFLGLKVFYNSSW
jgi:hypothetical protein